MNREAHERLSVELRIAAADHVARELIAVLLIDRTDNGWSVTAAPVLTELLADLVVAEDLGVCAALERIAADIDAHQVPDVTPGPEGLGVLINHSGDGTGALGLTALCDGAVHAITWGYVEAFPDWEIDSISPAQETARPVLAAYQRLLDALHRTD
jgi:hypothetical protein